MAAETTAGFMIDGVLYEMPALDSFTMDEAQVLYDYSGITIEDFAPADGVEPDENGEFELDDEQKQKMKNPGFLRALMHIAYQRGNPRLNGAKVKTLIGSANLVESLQHLADGEGDALPPASTNTPDEPSPSSTPGSNGNSGDGSEKSSDGPVVQLAATTTTESDTSSTPSQTSSAA